MSKQCISKEEFARILDREIGVWEKSIGAVGMKFRLGGVSREEILEDIWKRFNVEDSAIDFIEKYLETDRYVDDLRWKKREMPYGGDNQS